MMKEDSDSVDNREEEGEQGWQPGKTSKTRVSLSPSKNRSHEILNKAVSC